MKKTWIYWIASLVFTIACIVVNSKVYFFPGMIKLEFANSANAMHNYIFPVGYHLLQMNTIVDYAFIAGYSLLTFYSFAIFLNVFQAAIKPWVYILSLATGFLDAIENVFLLATAIKEKEVYSWIYFWAVRIKWAFSIVPVLLITIILLYSLVVLFRAKQNN
jgi:hypothetical protein